MADELNSISKSVSVLYRLSQIYYDVQLSPYQIGCGQQFFLLTIHDHPGISPYKLAKGGTFDKGTTARAIKKLEELGYIRRAPDPMDKRSCKLYETEKARDVVRAIQQVLDRWQGMITQDFTQEEAALIRRLLDKLARNAHCTVKPNRKDS